ncbi:MAG: NYN domain-containing protein [Ilumatobacteraceae bacterium]
MSTDEPPIADRLLRSALEHAVKCALVGSRRSPAEPFPPGLRRFFSSNSLSASALTAVRRIVEGDDGFRQRVAATASADLVDELGRVWLGRPEGWHERATELLGTGRGRADATAAEAGAALRHEVRRREAAESHRDRLEGELEALRTRSERQVTELEERLSALEDDRERLERTLASERDRANRAESRAVRAERAAEALGAATGSSADELDGLRRRLAAAESARDAALADRADREGAALDRDRLRGALLDALSALGTDQRAARTAPLRRVPVGLPGGVRADSPSGVEFLCRVPDVLVVVDGYNVAKLAWPDRSLAQQRDACIASAEAAATRWGTNITVVFDGASVPGASSPARRLVTVTYSPEGVSADDVIRSIVADRPSDRPVVVVTNDRAVRDDVQARGANPVSSDAFVAATR